MGAGGVAAVETATGKLAWKHERCPLPADAMLGNLLSIDGRPISQSADRLRQFGPAEKASKPDAPARERRD